MLVRPLALAAVLVACASSAAQVVLHDSLTNWTHLGGPPGWTDDLPNTLARFGKVDQLNQDTILDYTSPTVTLGPGTYVATVRLLKMASAAGIAPIDLWTTVNGKKIAVQLDVASQTIDAFVHTPELLLTVTNPGTVLTFKLENLDATVTKQGYQFDAFMLGQVELGPVLLYQSLTRTWGHAWGPPYYTEDVADSASGFGYVSLLNYVWWFDWSSPAIILEPGVYTANVRLKKLGSLTGAQDMDFYAHLQGGPSFQVTQLGATLPIDQYTHTPDLVFTVTQPATVTTFQLTNTTGSRKQLYHFDAFALRRGAAVPYGTACASTLGPVVTTSSIPRLGETLAVSISSVPLVAMLGFGGAATSIDLTSAGMPGCTLYTMPLLLAGTAASNGVASFWFGVPPDFGLTVNPFFLQGFALDPGANFAGIAASQGVQVHVGY